MSNKRQITSNTNNRLFAHMIKRRWEMNSRLTTGIKNLEEWKSIEKEKLKKISDPIEEKKQIEKICRLIIAIKKHEQARDKNLEVIRNISSTLSYSTC